MLCCRCAGATAAPYCDAVRGGMEACTVGDCTNVGRRDKHFSPHYSSGTPNLCSNMNSFVLHQMQSTINVMWRSCRPSINSRSAGAVLQMNRTKVL